MMGTREALKGGAEYDYLTRWRRFEKKKAGRFTATKRGFWKRVRKQYKLRSRNEDS